MGSHAVELIAEFLQLVAGLDLNALRQVATADAGGAVAQRANRDDHPSCQVEAGECRQHQGGEENGTGAQK